MKYLLSTVQIAAGFPSVEESSEHNCIPECSAPRNLSLAAPLAHLHDKHDYEPSQQHGPDEGEPGEEQRGILPRPATHLKAEFEKTNV